MPGWRCRPGRKLEAFAHWSTNQAPGLLAPDPVWFLARWTPTVYNPWLQVRRFYDVGTVQGKDVSPLIINHSSLTLSRFSQCLCSPCMTGSPLSAISIVKQCVTLRLPRALRHLSIMISSDVLYGAIVANWFLGFLLLGTSSQAFLKGYSLLRVRSGQEGPHYDPDVNVSINLYASNTTSHTWCLWVIHPDLSGFNISHVNIKVYGAWQAFHCLVLGDRNKALAGKMAAWSPSWTHSSY